MDAPAKYLNGLLEACNDIEGIQCTLHNAPWERVKKEQWGDYEVFSSPIEQPSYIMIKKEEEEEKNSIL